MRLSEIKSKIDNIATGGVIKIKHQRVTLPLTGGYGYEVEDFSEILDTLSPLAKFSWFNADESMITALKAEYGGISSPVTLTDTHFNAFQNMVAHINQAQDLVRVSDVLSMAVDEQNPHSVFFKVPDNVTTPEQFSDWQSRMSSVLKIVAAGGSGTFKFAGTEQGSSWFGWIADPTTYLLLVSVIKVAFKSVRYLKDNPVDDVSVEALIKTFQPEITEDEMPDAVKKFREQQRQKITEDGIKEQQDALSVYFESQGVKVSVSAVGRGVNNLLPEILDNGQEVSLAWTRPKYISDSDDGLGIDLSEVDTSSLGQPNMQLSQPEEHADE